MDKLSPELNKKLLEYEKDKFESKFKEIFEKHLKKLSKDELTELTNQYVSNKYGVNNPRKDIYLGLVEEGTTR